MKIHSVLLPAIIAAFILSGCHMFDDDDTDSSVAKGNGTITGSVMLIDSLGNLLPDLSGVVVSLEGTTISATSGIDGRWTLNHVPSRSYTISYNKVGFGVVKNISYEYAGGDTAFLSNVVLSMPPKRAMGFSSCTVGAGAIGIGGTFPTVGWESFIACVATDSTVLIHGPNTRLPFFQYYAGGSSAGDWFGIGTTITIGALHEAGIASGTKIYCALYELGFGENAQSFSNYYDPRTQQWVFSAAGPPSTILSVIVP